MRWALASPDLPHTRLCCCSYCEGAALGGVKPGVSTFPIKEEAVAGAAREVLHLTVALSVDDCPAHISSTGPRSRSSCQLLASPSQWGCTADRSLARCTEDPPMRPSALRFVALPECLRTASWLSTAKRTTRIWQQLADSKWVPKPGPGRVRRPGSNGSMGQQRWQWRPTATHQIYQLPFWSDLLDCPHCKAHGRCLERVIAGSNHYYGPLALNLPRSAGCMGVRFAGPVRTY